MIKVAINGFGRIGRMAFREMIVSTDFDIVAINDLTDPEELAYLLKYDTNHRSFHEEMIKSDNDELIINDRKRIKVYKEKDPENLPWKDLDIDLVLECTGLFTNFEGANKHIKAGAKKVLISAPAKDNIKTIVYNVNDTLLESTDQIISGASCTTNCLAPVLKVLNDTFGIEKCLMSTIHAYTNDQATLDIPHKKGIKERRGRACAMNIIPTSSGVTKAIGLVIPELAGKVDGLAYRVPVSDGSLCDLSIELKQNVTKEQINEALLNHQNETLKVTFDPIVSSDVIGKKCGSLVDASITNVLEVNGKALVKVACWYDNELGYTNQMLRTAKKMFDK
ncbi:MAG: type I glyceraldehyde-3-phosphate dehydrogenase [Bacilli bacterium]|jgi:glyceraldehyde 3-phosphate dehydrogenase|nr:type I glyceraldehyde-3-phosphate dehydrogenase [Bacilli bacterium]